MSKITLTAPAKLNLSLAVTGKNANGYHLLDSIVVFTQYGDEIQVKLNNSKEFKLAITGEFGEELDCNNNSIIKGCELIHSFYIDINGADITLIKNLPVSSGIGGGSSDCATVMKALLKLWGKPIPNNFKSELLGLGSDMPVCFKQKSVIMQGIGEILTPYKIPQLYLVLVNPKKTVSTKKTFKEFNDNFVTAPKYPNILDLDILISFLNQTNNSLTYPAIKICQEILEVLKFLKHNNTKYVGMSGSGATCFAICKNKTTADEITKSAIKHGYWAISTSCL